MRGSSEGFALTLAACVMGCGPSAIEPREPSDPTLLVPLAPPAPAPFVSETRPPADPYEALLQHVSDVRGLPIRRAVPERVLSREGMVAHMRAITERETPESMLRAQGEILAALDLVPPDYDFVAGIYALLEDAVAGLYDPDDATMYLVADLDEAEREQTLLHELVHALQDQSYSLATRLRYVPGDSDRRTALHTLAEGDATSAMYAAMGATIRGFRTTAESHPEEGSTVPPVLYASLLAPYLDGLRFVEGLRKKGGYAAVDAVWKDPPTTTEQLLHADKLASHEPAVALPKLQASLLEKDWELMDEDAMGEQGLRLVLEQWTDAASAERAAAGWGGDALAVLTCRGCAAGNDTYAVVWRLVFDTENDAVELSDIFSQRFSKTCRERPQSGPLTWTRSGNRITLVTGPHSRTGGTIQAEGHCPQAIKHLSSIHR